jgi:molybdopterin converting factor small subunit
MTVTLCFFGELKTLTGCERDQLPFTKTLSLAELVRMHPAATKLLAWEGHLLYAVNHEQVDADYLVHDGDEVALMPPMTGG